jgi:hypothetical protein
MKGMRGLLVTDHLRVDGRVVPVWSPAKGCPLFLTADHDQRAPGAHRVPVQGIDDAARLAHALFASTQLQQLLLMRHHYGPKWRTVATFDRP